MERLRLDYSEKDGALLQYLFTDRQWSVAEEVMGINGIVPDIRQQIRSTR